MATISENLQTIKTSTDAIKQAIIGKGGKISGNITTWADAISAIESGGSGGPGSGFKITNKLNGQLFGGPSYNGSSIIQSYQFDGGTDVLAALTIVPVNAQELNTLFPTMDGLYYGSNFLRTALKLYDKCGDLRISFKGNEIQFSANGSPSSPSSIPLEVAVICFDTNKNYDIDFFKVQGGGRCFLKDTKITLSDNSIKLIQDITYNDELLVWNFDEGKYDVAKPLWIKKEEITNNYYKVTLDNGETIGLVGSNGRCHRLFDYDDMIFEYATELIGKNVYTLNGICKVISVENIKEIVEYYNIITDFHMNLFANSILTSCRYNNLYPIQDMKFVKDDRLNRAPKWRLYEQFRDHRELDRYIDGLRLYEQLDIPLEDTIKYCTRLNDLRKTLNEFEGNENIKNTIEDTEVGWIDREGKSYGFKLYMPGQNNHNILADKICEELNIQTDNPSRYLEKEGWLKYTTDYVFNYDDKEITDKQLESLRKFLKVPNKLKTEGKIRIGDYRSPYVDISEFDTMDKYSFEYRKRHNRQ